MRQATLGDNRFGYDLDNICCRVHGLNGTAASAYRGGEVTWEEMIRQPEVFKLDIAELKA
jgi:hypothetical protein